MHLPVQVHVAAAAPGDLAAGLVTTRAVEHGDLLALIPFSRCFKLPFKKEASNVAQASAARSSDGCAVLTGCRSVAAPTCSLRLRVHAVTTPSPPPSAGSSSSNAARHQRPAEPPPATVGVGPGAPPARRAAACGRLLIPTGLPGAAGCARAGAGRILEAAALQAVPAPCSAGCTQTDAVACTHAHTHTAAHAPPRLRA